MTTTLTPEFTAYADTFGGLWDGLVTGDESTTGELIQALGHPEWGKYARDAAAVHLLPEFFVPRHQASLEDMNPYLRAIHGNLSAYERDTPDARGLVAERILTAFTENLPDPESDSIDSTLAQGLVNLGALAVQGDMAKHALCQGSIDAGDNWVEVSVAHGATTAASVLTAASLLADMADAPIDSKILGSLAALYAQGMALRILARAS